MDTFPRRRTARGEDQRTGRLARMGTRRGWADFQIFHTDGRVMFLEVKRPGGRLSPDQQRIADHMLAAGHAFEVVDSISAAIAVLVAWGVVRSMTVPCGSAGMAPGTVLEDNYP